MAATVGLLIANPSNTSRRNVVDLTGIAGGRSARRIASFGHRDPVRCRRRLALAARECQARSAGTRTVMA